MNLVALYKALILDNPIKVVFLFCVLSIISLFYAQDFELDASGESLVLENDESLNYYREISQKYVSDDFVIITFEPKGDLFSNQSLQVIRNLRNKLIEIENIESVISILDVPIIYESGLPLSELTNNLLTLNSKNVDLELARREFNSNPLYQELLISADGKTTALQAVFKRDEEYYKLINRRLALQNQDTKLLPNEAYELQSLNQKIKEKNKLSALKRHEDIVSIRQIIEQQSQHGTFYLGGIPMITVDMIDFIKYDLIVFGGGVLLFLVFILSLFFHKLRWVILPLLTCGITGLLTIGLLGYLSWAITVISSNFLSILLIINLSLMIHLIVRYRDLHLQYPSSSNIELLQLTLSSMVRPCLYTVLTTAVAFASLVVSEIRPVIDFGWIMVIGLGIAFIVSFTFMPAILVLLSDIDKPAGRDYTRVITLSMAKQVHNHPVLIVISATLIFSLVAIGINQLKVENRFINNFKSSTEIYQGMMLIDHKLGGTMPLDIIIDPDKNFIETIDELNKTSELDDLFLDETESSSESTYWLNPYMLEKAKRIQAHLDSYDVIGKTISIVTTLSIIEKLNNGPLDEFELALIHKRIPDSISKSILNPYLSEDTNQIRFSLRIVESEPSLNRNHLLTSIHDFLIKEMQFEETQVHLTGMMVLYNNMLQSLFRSQILTIGAVFAAILFMFIILFKNIQLALIAIIPNIFSAGLILGIMGWAGIPLDMMTITIAAITIGISVDDTIHYIHRLQQEYAVDQNYLESVKRCHGGIGKAIYYTSVAIIFGFALLSFSNFIPTIYFGLLTGFAMLVALLGDLLLLPSVVLITKPRI